MNMRLFVSSLSVVAALATACGGDAKSPKIRSFNGTPDTLPTLGGETTLVWDVKNADSLELLPDIGAVSGTSLTLVITETTQFTLVAKKDGRTDRKKTTVTCAAPNTVQGIVRFSTTRDVFPGVGVFVNGEATLTDEAGRFYFEDVPTPYDVAVFIPESSPFVLFYKGLTRFDPIIEFPFSMSGPTIQVQGTVTPTTAAANTFTTAAVKSPTAVLPSATTADNGTGAYTATNVPYFCAFDCPSTDAQKTAIVATRYTYPGTGLVTYTHLGRGTRDITPADGNVTGFDVTLSPVSNAVTTGRFVFDPWEDVTPINATMILDSASGASTDVGFVLPTAAMSVTTAFAFSVASPDVDGQIQIWSQYADMNTTSIGFHVTRLTPGETNVDVDFPPLVQALTPVDAGIVTASTKFQLAAYDDTVKMFSVQSPSLFLLVFTTETALTLPDLSALGIQIQHGDPITWNAMEIQPARSTDAIVGEDGVFGAQPTVWGFTQPRDALYQDEAAVNP